MTPAARVQAAIELLDLIIVATRDDGAAADTIIGRWFRERRYAGSKDRRAISEIVYRAIRAFGDVPSSGRAALLAFEDLVPLFGEPGYGPPSIGEAEVAAKPRLLPAWLEKRIPAGEQEALLARAPFDLRVNTLKATRTEALALFDGAVAIEGTRWGVRLPDNIVLKSLPEAHGLIEVQDAGSQLIAEACAVSPGQTVIDLCAGAGGKTLALAADLAGKGRLIACDTDRGRLSRLPQRAAVAGAVGIETRLLDPKREMEALADLAGTAACVLVDAPCSGSGTWRRNPELRWRLTPQRLKRTMQLQAEILAVAAPLVAPGGVLVYAVCSLLSEEGADQVTAFLARNLDFAPGDTKLSLGRPEGPGRLLTPAQDGTDGFFVARLARTC
ncbi:MAG: hypothetical protein RIS52_2548 [Pseudomonadota bacterium]